jgi:energy-coupling factor transporter ATP-binding protein EcfA2
VTSSRHFSCHRLKLAPKTRGISLEFRSGSEGLVVESPEQAQAFIECAVGIRRPLGGSLRSDNGDPFSSPRLRAKIGSVLPFEPPFSGHASLGACLTELLALRNQMGAAGVTDVTALPLIEELTERRPDSLTDTERRRVALSLALSLDDPFALFLFEPLRDLKSGEVDWLLGRLDELKQGGSIVVTLTVTQRTASLLCERISRLGERVTSAEDAQVSFLLRVERPRELAAVLASAPCIQSAHFDEARPTQLLVETGSEMDAARAITEAICSTQSEPFEMVRHAHSRHLSGTKLR